MKNFVSFLVLIAAFVGFIYIYNYFMQPGPIGCEFNLISSNGEKITEKDIRAKPAVVFFGYTMCPDICPTTMVDMQNWIEQLGTDANKLGWWFFSVDPQRDTPQVMHSYLSSFPKNIIGISGDAAKVSKVIKAFNIVAKKVPGENNDYTYDHTAAVILLRKGGRSYGIIPFQADVGAQSERNGIGLDKLKQLIKDEYR